MYDIIGDIHGHADSLEILLQKLGYVRKLGIYAHPEKRKVAFVGDFIDRGPKIRETLHIVKDMCDSGNAIAVMGNHEYNAICFHTPHTEKGGFFRNHTVKEIEQHLETLRQFKHYNNEWLIFLEWFKTLPLYFENDDFRMVHACWDENHIRWIKNNYKGISRDFLTKASDRENPDGVYKAIEETLKGKEFSLQEGHEFTDKDGTVRTECRIKWWSKANDANTYGQVLMECPVSLADQKLTEKSLVYTYTDSKPVFFGHYWLNGLPDYKNQNAICLDYSVAKGGKLVACRLTKEKKGTAMNFIY